MATERSALCEWFSMCELISMQKELSPCANDSSKAGFFSGLSIVYFPVLAQAVEELDLLTTEKTKIPLATSASLTVWADLPLFVNGMKHRVLIC